MDMPTSAEGALHDTPFSYQISLDPSASPWRNKVSANGVHVLSGTAWLDAVVALHEKVRAEMPEHQRHFLLPKQPSYFRDLLNGTTGILFGAFADNKLVGSMALVWADSFATALAAGRLTVSDSRGRLNKKYGKGRVGIIQSMGVTNAFSGRGFSRTLLQAAIEQAAKRGCAHVFAQIAEQNTLSWLRFMDQNFAIVTTWTSGHRRFLLRWLSPHDKTKLLKRVKPYDRQTYAKNYTQMPALIGQLASKVEQGRVACLDNNAYEPGALKVVFSPARLKIIQALSAFKKSRHAST